jgi:hypothetical protein
MKVMLKARKLCHAIKIDIENEEEDCTAMEAILKAVPSEYVESLGSKDFVNRAWDTLKAMCVGSDCVKKAKALRLQWEYKVLAFRDGKAVEDFALWLQSLVSQLMMLGIIVAKYLRVVPAKYA